MRRIDLHCYPGTQEWITSQGPYVEALGRYWGKEWTGKSEEDVVADVKAVFDSLPAARQDGVRAVSLGGQAEVGQGPGAVPLLRYCSGTMLATDTVEYAIDYSFERRQEDVIIRLQLANGR